LEDNEAGEGTEPTEPEHLQYVHIPKYEHVPGVLVDLPVYQFGWESYHSTENQIGGLDFAAPALCDALDLRSRRGSVDFVDSAGRGPAFAGAISGDVPDSTSICLGNLLRESYQAIP
jgi:hypothetical protein